MVHLLQNTGLFLYLRWSDYKCSWLSIGTRKNNIPFIFYPDSPTNDSIYNPNSQALLQCIFFPFIHSQITSYSLTFSVWERGWRCLRRFGISSCKQSYVNSCDTLFFSPRTHRTSAYLCVLCCPGDQREQMEGSQLGFRKWWGQEY